MTEKSSKKTYRRIKVFITTIYAILTICTSIISMFAVQKYLYVSLGWWSTFSWFVSVLVLLVAMFILLVFWFAIENGIDKLLSLFSERRETRRLLNEEKVKLGVTEIEFTRSLKEVTTLNAQINDGVRQLDSKMKFLENVLDERKKALQLLRAEATLDSESTKRLSAMVEDSIKQNKRGDGFRNVLINLFTGLIFFVLGLLISKDRFVEFFVNFLGL